MMKKISLLVLISLLAFSSSFSQHLLKDIYEGTNSSYIEGMSIWGNKIVFFANYYNSNISSSSSAIFITDGTPEGTMMIDSISGTENPDIDNFFASSNKIFFTADTGVSSTEPWVSDGTSEGTFLLKEINATADDMSSNPKNFTQMGDYVYFPATDGIEGRALWRSDGTTDGTTMVHPINTVTHDGDTVGYDGGAHISNLFLLNNKIYFRAFDTAGTAGYQLWVTDGTYEGTFKLTNVPDDPYFQNKHELGDKVIFVTDDGYGDDLWITDGTVEGTYQIDINPADGTTDTDGDADVDNIKIIDGIAYFQADDGEGNGNELWVSDGTPEGTYMLKDINTGANSSNPEQFKKFGDNIYFTAYDDVNGDELRVIKPNGDVELVFDIAPGNTDSYTNYFQQFGDKIICQAYHPNYGTEPWIIDGDTAYILKDINPGLNGSNPYKFHIYNNKLFFQCYDPTYGYELWRSDGTEEGTEIIKDIYIGPGSSYVNSWNELEGRYVFTMTTSTEGEELFAANLLKIVSQPEALINVNENNYVVLSLEVFGEGEITYQWYKDGEILNDSVGYVYGSQASSIAIVNYTQDFEGTYTCLITDEFYGELMSDEYQLTFTNTDKLTNSNISVFPNPSNGIFTITNAQGSNAVITDLKGSVVSKLNINNNQSTIDLTNQAEGVYFIKISNDKEVTSLKLIKK